MALPNVFQTEDVEVLLNRLDQLTPDTQRKWGKMSVEQMLAHLHVAYELVYEQKHPQPNFLIRWIMKTFVKQHIVNETPYKQNIGTAPYFIISDQRVFRTEQQRLRQYILKTQASGSGYFEGRTSHAFGPLTATEWNNMFYKHLDHHFRQFGV